MQRFVVISLTLVMLVSSSIATLQGAPPVEAKPLNIPVVYYKLPNGLKVVISEDHIAPVVTVAVYYNVGFRLEPKGRTGFAHLFEHMMFQGSANVKKFEHAKFIEANGGSLNGHTDLMKPVGHLSDIRFFRSSKIISQMYNRIVRATFGLPVAMELMFAIKMGHGIILLSWGLHIVIFARVQ